MPDFLLPDLGEGLEQAEILRWYVSAGDAITVDQVVVEVETAKAAVEVPAPFAGTITALHGSPGDTLDVGAPLMGVDEPGAGERASTSAGSRDPGVVNDEPSQQESSGNVLVGYGTCSTPRRRRNRRNARGAKAAEKPAESSGDGRGTDANPTSAAISPLVRKLARDRGLDLARIAGSGANGVVRRADVEAAVPDSTSVPEEQPTSGDARESGQDGRGDRRIPLRGRRKAVADKMTRSRREIPEATVWVDADATDLVNLRKAINDRSPDERVSLLSLIARFTVAALAKFPELNSQVDGDEIVLRGSVHLGVATETDRGLLVPVVEHADKLSARGISEAVAAHAHAGRAGTLQPAQLTGSTFTINNYGVFGVDGSAAIINHPEAGILGIGRIIDRPWVVDGELASRSLCPLTLAFDHRVCDGGTAGGFLRFIADCIEAPTWALAEL